MPRVWLKMVLAALVIGHFAGRVSAQPLPPEAARLLEIDLEHPLNNRMSQIMSNSRQLADMGHLEAAADLRATMLDHFPRGFQEPYDIRPLGTLWGIRMGDALQRGEWNDIIDWYRRAGKYRKMIDAYEKILRDPYDVFREWEAYRHRETIERYRAQLDSVFIENLSATGGFFVDAGMTVRFDVVNTHLEHRDVGEISWAVKSTMDDAIIAKGTVSVQALPAESRRGFDFQPGITKPGNYRLDLQGGEVSASTAFSFTAARDAITVSARGARLCAHSDAILTEGAYVVEASWAEGNQAVRFPGRARFTIELESEATFYIRIDSRLGEAYEQTTWNIWVNDALHTPEGRGVLSFAHTAISDVEAGARHETLWRVPVTLPAGGHTIDVSLSLDQELSGITLLPAINDRLQVKAVHCAAPFALFYPDEPTDLTMVLENTSDQALTLGGRLIYGQYRQRGVGGWWAGNKRTQASQSGSYAEFALAITIPAGETHPVSIDYTPGKKGFVGVTLVLEHEDGIFIGSGADHARIFRPVEGFREFSMFMCEARNADAVRFAARLGFKWGRWGGGEEFYEACRENQFYNIPVIMGGDRSFLPQNHRIGTDYLPAPGALPNFEQWVYERIKPYTDVIGAVNFFNEPWEGKTYWGFGSRGDHYRQALKYLYRGVKRADPNIPVIANDDSHNVRWNLLAEPGMENYFDGASIHYGGIARQEAPYFRSLGKYAINTEFWIGHQLDDTQVVVEHLLHFMHGYDGFNSALLYWAGVNNGTVRPRYRLESVNGQLRHVTLGGDDAAVNSAVFSPLIHFLEDTDYVEVVNPLTVPWVFAFRGRLTKEKRNVAVLVSNVGPGFPGDQARDKWNPYGAGQELRSHVPEHKHPARGSFSIPDPQRRLAAYDILGNPIDAHEGGNLLVPVSSDAVYITHTGDYDDFAAMLRAGTTMEHRPYEIMLHDFVRPLTDNASLRVKVRNLYPQPSSGTLRIETPGEIILAQAEQAIPELGPGETATLEFPVVQANPNAANEYLIVAYAESAEGDMAVLKETLSVSVAVYGTITVDGNLDEWEAIGAIPQFLTSQTAMIDPAYRAHNPFTQFREAGHSYFGEFATAWDDNYFYVMARVYDPAHTWQLSNFRDYERYKFFPYPNDYVYRSRGQQVSVNPPGLYVNIQGIEKGEGYRRYPEDVYDPTDWQYRMGMFRNTDYDYVLYDTRYGAELFRYRRDDFYYLHPFPANVDFMRLNCQVRDAKTAIVFDEETSIVNYEMAIPWSEMDKITPGSGLELKLGWMLNRSHVDKLEWTQGRSVSVLNAAAFEPEFFGGWSIETPWGLYRAE